MAENEILDIRGRRWNRSRAALAEPHPSLTYIAQCLADDLNRGLHHQLSEAFHAGQTLLLILRAANQDRAALRAVVASFQDQELARTIRNACEVAGTQDFSKVAHCAMDMLFNGLMDKALVFAARNEDFQDPVQRSALARTLWSELEARRGELVSVVEASLRGERVRRVRRVRDPGSQPVEARSLVRKSLTINAGGGVHAVPRS